MAGRWGETMLQVVMGCDETVIDLRHIPCWVKCAFPMLGKLRSHKICSLAGRNAGPRAPTYTQFHEERLRNTTLWLGVRPVGTTRQHLIMQLGDLFGDSMPCDRSFVILRPTAEGSWDTCLIIFASWRGACSG